MPVSLLHIYMTGVIIRQELAHRRVFRVSHLRAPWKGDLSVANKIFSKKNAKGFSVNPVKAACRKCSLTMFFVPKPGSGNPVKCWSCGEENPTG